MADDDDVSNVLALARLLTQDEPVSTELTLDGYFDVLRGERVVGSLDDNMLATFLEKAPPVLLHLHEEARDTTS
ncbi:MAG: hypothetical protein GEU98_18640 [Pseudonocardiaceae bacterium]|nr:hypothetical protein [Pseudonocardiaceae bacterium]